MRVKNLLKQYRLKPKKRLGQNFLISEVVLRKIIKAAKLQANDIVLEIGPGLGALTCELARRVKKVIAVEKDRQITKILKEVLKSQEINNVEIVQSDILKTQNAKFKAQSYNLKLKTKTYKVVANLPYYIASPVIRMFLETKFQPKTMVLLVQKEVGQRICSKPPKMNLLAVSVQFYAKPEFIATVSKKSFWPQPKVDSAIIRITPKKLTTTTILVDSFSEIVKAGFSHPRKQLLNNFQAQLNLPRERVKRWLLKNNISPKQRAETLSLNNWLALAKTFSLI